MDNSIDAHITLRQMIYDIESKSKSMEMHLNQIRAPFDEKINRVIKDVRSIKDSIIHIENEFQRIFNIQTKNVNDLHERLRKVEQAIEKQSDQNYTNSLDILYG